DTELVGCTVRQVGPVHVENWPAFVRAVRELQHRTPDGSDPTFVRQDGEDRVRVMLQRSPGEEPFAIWCVMGRPPLQMTLPALPWLILEVGLFVIGALVYWKRPDDRYAGPFFGITIAAVGAYLGGYHWTQIVTQPVLMVLFMTSAVLLPAVTLHYFHVFP